MDFRKFFDPIWDLALKRVSKFVIPEFRDTLLVTKITKCGDLLYIYLKNDMTSRNFPNRMRELTPIETNPAVRLIKNVQETGNKKVDLKLN